jgi:serine/threonine protein kinase
MGPNGVTPVPAGKFETNAILLGCILPFAYRQGHSMALEPGQVIDQYRLDQTIHRGHATVVYAATDLGLGRKVAFKVLTDRYATDPSIRQRFVTEAQIAASLDGHPHIVTVYKWGQYEDSMYFVTELIDGISLAELLERQPGGQPLPPAEALSLFDQIASAIDFAHKRGAIHRDVKPANIMIKMTETPRSAYLVDFGITKMGDGDHTNPVGMFLGTPDYASPEQISGAQALDRRADVYSLACTAFHTLTGRPPYGDAPSDAARISAHLQAPVPSARALRPELPEGIDAVFAKALAKNRDDRYASCSDFVRDLRAAFPTAAHEFRRALPTSAEMPPPSLYGPEEPPRRKWPFVVIGLAAAVIATTLAFFLTSGMRNPTITGSLGEDATTSTTTTTTTTSTTTTTTTTTTVPATTTTVVNPSGFVAGAAVTNPGDDLGAQFALGVQNRDLPATIAPPGSRARLYAEWVWAIGPAEPGPVVASRRGFVIASNTPVEIFDFQIAEGAIVDFSECRRVGDEQRCSSLAEHLERVDNECPPGENCPTLRTSTGETFAFLRAYIRMHHPQEVLVYQIAIPDRVVASIAEPTSRIAFEPGSGYFIAFYEGIPAPGTEQLLTVTYEDGTTDRVIVAFNMPAPATTTTP